MHGSDNHEVNLPSKIPVYIVYFTTYVDGGQIFFGNDLYDRDSKLVQQLANSAVPSPETIQAQIDAARAREELVVGERSESSDSAARTSAALFAMPTDARTAPTAVSSPRHAANRSIVNPLRDADAMQARVFPASNPNARLRRAGVAEAAAAHRDAGVARATLDERIGKHATAGATAR